MGASTLVLATSSTRKFARDSCTSSSLDSGFLSHSSGTDQTDLLHLTSGEESKGNAGVTTEHNPDFHQLDYLYLGS